MPFSFDQFERLDQAIKQVTLYLKESTMSMDKNMNSVMSLQDSLVLELLILILNEQLNLKSLTIKKELEIQELYLLEKL
jgi:hypothetical protein